MANKEMPSLGSAQLAVESAAKNLKAAQTNFMRASERLQNADEAYVSATVALTSEACQGKPAWG